METSSISSIKVCSNFPMPFTSRVLSRARIWSALALESLGRRPGIKILGYTKDEVIKAASPQQFFPVGGAEQFREALQPDEYGGKNRISISCSNASSISSSRP